MNKQNKLLGKRESILVDGPWGEEFTGARE